MPWRSDEGVRSARDLGFVDFLKPAPTNPAPCLKCGEAHDIWPEIGPEPFGLYCRKCGWSGPRAAVDDEDPGPAIAAWNGEARKVAQARELGLTVNLDQPPLEAEDVC